MLILLTKRSLFGIATILIATTVGLTSCSAEDDEKAATAAATTTYPMYLSIQAMPAAASSSLQLVNNFQNESIASGAPDTFKLYVTKIAVQQDDSVEVPVFVDDDGQELTIKSGSIDISNLFTTINCMDTEGNIVELTGDQTCECGLDASGSLIAKVDDGEGNLSCPALAEGETPPVGVMEISQAGSYNKMLMSFLRVGKAKGCVSGNFRTSSYTSDDPGTGESKTFCTQAAGAVTTTSETAAASTFEVSTAEEMDIELGGLFTGEGFNLTFPVTTAFTIGDETTPRMNIVVDTNRLLRFFYADNGSNRAAQADWPQNASYFFTGTSLQNTMFGFVGDSIGSIKGYEVTSLRQRGSGSATCSADNVSSYVCSTVADCSYVKGWLTAIFDADGTPFMWNVLPDDDNVGLKGNNSARTGPDGSLIVATSTAGSYNLGFDWSDFNGTIYGFELDGALNGTVEANYCQIFPGLGEWEKGSITATRKL